MTPDKPSASEAREPPDFYKMSGPDLLAYCGDDASKWAEAFCKIKTAQGWDAKDIDEGLMTCWFANAIEHSSQVRASSIASPSPAVNEWQPIETAPKGRNILLDYDGNVVIGGFCRLNQYWTDGENYIPTKDIRGWMPIPLTDKRPPMQEDGK